MTDTFTPFPTPLVAVVEVEVILRERRRNDVPGYDHVTILGTIYEEGHGVVLAFADESGCLVSLRDFMWEDLRGEDGRRLMSSLAGLFPIGHVPAKFRGVPNA
ncbi:hypothetical protein [Tsukamurella tyrosinosolvens]|uniref:hypothetical protein n=1 Tax=Tsukamurella tyrosinosolvens TaxID=57704 RepID=UPI002DD442CC|nr:hypothetical protein [Tsukamurella tyrosinosolvens]MEC4611815.1 hypothetical protein [Tsukamurella tyrosinosolvens]